MRIPILLLLPWTLLVLACTGFPSLLPPTLVPGQTPDIEATIRAAVAEAVRAAAATPAPGGMPDPEATMVAKVQATVEALLATPPVPALGATPAPNPNTASIPSLTPEASPAPTAAPVPAGTPESVAAALPTPEGPPEPDPALQPTPVPALAATLTPTLTPPPTPTFTPQPAPTPQPEAACQPVADGTVVTAWIEGSPVASATVADGSFVLFVDQPEGGSFSGKRVAFKIGGLEADGSAVWTPGGGDQLDLTATAQGLPGRTPSPASSLPGGYSPTGLLAQPAPPHVFLGTAAICRPS